MNKSRGQEVKSTLQNTEAHDEWVKRYRTPENDTFYNDAFDFISNEFGPPEMIPLLDAGCGTSIKSIHLARRGYTVLAVDFSRKMLDQGRTIVVEQGLQNKISHRVEDLTKLSFKNECFHRILCWGVLMHVPDVEKAIAELSRITCSGGCIIVSEGNKNSLQAILFRVITQLLRRHTTTIWHTPAGIEYWKETPSGKLLTRQMRISWLVKTFKAYGLRLDGHRAGQFSELFTVVRWRPMRQLIHVFNTFWFRCIKLPGPAFSNILVFRKK